MGRRRATSALVDAGVQVLANASSPAGLGPDTIAAEVLILVLEGAGEEERASLLAAVGERVPNARLIATAAAATPREIRAALADGADGFVLDDRLDEALASTIAAVCAGQLVVPRELHSQIARPTLSAREKQVLGMVALGFTNGEIAAKLHLAESTVKSHLSSIFGKLGVRSRSEAAELVLDREHGFGTGILAMTADRG